MRLDRPIGFGPVVACLAIALALAMTTVSVAWDNWPQWRGDRWDSVSNETGLPEALNQENRLWRTELPGPAGSSPVVWDQRVFLTTVDGDDLWLLCLGTEDGSLIWKQQLGGRNQPVRDRGNSASPSPSTDGKHVWAMVANGHLHCFTVDGEPVWHKDLQEAYGKFDIQFGMTTTPILDQGRLYVQLMHGAMRSRDPGIGWVIALDAETGQEVWKHRRQSPATAENKHSYASPLIVRVGDDAFLVSHGADYAIGHSLEDGRERWRCGGLNPTESYNPFLRLVSSPVYRDGLLVVPSAKSGPVLGLEASQLDERGDISDSDEAIRWRMDRNTPDVASPVVYDGIVYLARENGVLIGVDAKSGEPLFEQRMLAGNHRSTPVGADGKLYIAGRDGTLLVLRAGSEPEILSKFETGEETTASPAISNGRVYIRTFDALHAFGSTEND